MSVTAIIPVRSSVEREDVVDRSLRLALQMKKLSFEVIIVVDDAPGSEYRSLAGSFRVTFTERKNVPMSLSICRNLGANLASTTWLLFLDADLDSSLINKDDFDSVMDSGYLRNPNSFLTLPVFYLAHSGAKLSKLDLLINHSLGYLAGASSVVLVRRDTFFKLGGYDEAFVGWGYEDHDFARKLVANQDFFPLPKRPQVFDPRPTDEQADYVGWRSLYSYVGDLALNAGLLFLHQPHAKCDRFLDYKLINCNRERFIKNSKNQSFPLLNSDACSIPGGPRFSYYRGVSSKGYFRYILHVNIRRVEVTFPVIVGFLMSWKRFFSIRRWKRSKV